MKRCSNLFTAKSVNQNNKKLFFLIYHTGKDKTC